jgi:hypothetical protein
MLSHRKIGQFKHCLRETVFTSVRARRLNLSLAGRLLDLNSDQFEDNGQSEKLFLWKAHNEGNGYFLNPKKMKLIEAIVSTGTSTAETLVP